MNGRRAIVGLCMACALLVSAFAAQSASAITGTTAFTCKNVGSGGGFSDSHCKTVQANGAFKHEAIAENTTTELTANSNEETVRLKTTIGGLGVTLVATGAEGSGWIENRVDPTGEHYSFGEGSLIFTGVTVAGFSGKCFVYKDEAGVKGEKEKAATEKLAATTTGLGDAGKFTPAVGGVFARFWILDANKKTSAEGGECVIGNTYVVSGSVTGTPNGATGELTHAGTTAQNTLKMGPTEAGAKAGIEGSANLEGRDPEIEGDTFKPLSPTTVTT